MGAKEILVANGGATKRVNIAVRVTLPPIPETVTVEVPSGVVAIAEIVNTLEHVEVQLEGANTAVAPPGKPATDKATVTVPVIRVTVMVACADSPRATVIFDVLNAREKSGGGAAILKVMIKSLRFALPTPS